MKRPLRYAALCALAVGGSVSGCGPGGCLGGSPVQVRVAELQEVSNQTVLIGKQYLPDAHRWVAWGLPALAPQGSWTLAPRNDLGVTFTVSGPGNRSDVLIFARDPEEYIETLSSLSNDDGAFKQQETACYLPSVVNLIYPGTLANFGTGPSLSSVQPLLTNTFWPTCPTPTGPAVIDFPGGGVSAVHVYDRGYCSKDITIDSIASQVQDGVWNNVWQQATPHGCAIARQYWSHYASYVSEVRSLSPDPAPSGGFVFNASYQIDPTDRPLALRLC